MPRKVKRSNQTKMERAAIISNLNSNPILDRNLRERLEEVLGVNIGDDLLSTGELFNLETSDLNNFDKQMLIDQYMNVSARGAVDDVACSLIFYQKSKALEACRPNTREVQKANEDVINSINTLESFMNYGFDVFTSQNFRRLLDKQGLAFKDIQERSKAFLDPLKSVAQQVEIDTAGVSSRGKRNKGCEYQLIRNLSSAYKFYLEELDAFLEWHKISKKFRGDDMENEFIREVLVYYNIPISTTNKALNQVKKIHRPHVNKTHCFINIK